jgi:hypothetical protein
MILMLAAAVPFVALRPKPPVQPPPAPSSPPQVETRISMEGYDRAQRLLPFTVYILTQELSWKWESAGELEGGQTLVSAELAAAANGAHDVFCVGTASSEGVTRAEEARAGRRGRQMAAWLEAVIVDRKRTRLFMLNAGQYVGPPELQSPDQRKAILIATGPHAEEVELGEALTSGLIQKQQLYPLIYSLLHHYSRSKEWLNSFERVPESGSPRAGPAVEHFPGRSAP